MWQAALRVLGARSVTGSPTHCHSERFAEATLPVENRVCWTVQFPGLGKIGCRVLDRHRRAVLARIWGLRGISRRTRSTNELLLG